MYIYPIIRVLTTTWQAQQVVMNNGDTHTYIHRPTQTEHKPRLPALWTYLHLTYIVNYPLKNLGSPKYLTYGFNQYGEEIFYFLYVCSTSTLFASLRYSFNGNCPGKMDEHHSNLQQGLPLQV